MFTHLERFAWMLHTNQKGQVTAWTIVVLVVFLGVMAFTIDLGFWLVDRRGGQNQVDAAVLAGGQELPAVNTSVAAAEAQTWLERNSRTGQGTVQSECGESGEYTHIDNGFAFADADGDGAYDKIRACIRRDGLVIFARVLDLTGVTVPAVAAAGVRQEPVPYALMAMNDANNCSPNDGWRSLYLHGNATVILGDGASYTATSCIDRGLAVEGNSEMSGGAHDVCGETWNGGGTLEPSTATPGICGYPDPWGGETQPTPGACKSGSFNFNGGTHTLTPGTYCTQVSIRNGAQVTMLPGIHIFRRGLTMTGGSLTAHDVVLFFTCSSGATCNGSVAGQMDVSGGDLNLSALKCGKDPHPDCPHPSQEPHIVIWIDRTATQQNNSQALVDLGGNGVVTVDGNIYNVNGSVRLRGTNDNTNWAFDGTLLGNKIDIAGTTTYNVNWDVEFAPTIPVLDLIQ